MCRNSTPETCNFRSKLECVVGSIKFYGKTLFFWNTKHGKSLFWLEFPTVIIDFSSPSLLCTVFSMTQPGTFQRTKASRLMLESLIKKVVLLDPNREKVEKWNYSLNAVFFALQTSVVLYRFVRLKHSLKFRAIKLPRKEKPIFISEISPWDSKANQNFVEGVFEETSAVNSSE